MEPYRPRYPEGYEFLTRRFFDNYLNINALSERILNE